MDDESSGFLSVLNVGAGDLKMTFDKDKPGDVERARRAIEDMLRRGYMIFLEGPDGLERVRAFDPTSMSYVVEVPVVDEPETEAIPAPDAPKLADTPRKRGRPKGTKKVPMTSTRATAVAATAGG
jgi:hypothetical protein